MTFEAGTSCQTRPVVRIGGGVVVGGGGDCATVDNRNARPIVLIGGGVVVEGVGDCATVDNQNARLVVYIGGGVVVGGGGVCATEDGRGPSTVVTRLACYSHIDLDLTIGRALTCRGAVYDVVFTYRTCLRISIVFTVQPRVCSIACGGGHRTVNESCN